MHLDGHWNHNTHYYDLILGAAPRGARRALDVGCGDGLLAGLLRNVIPEVTAIDSDELVLHRAGGQRDDVEWIVGDVMTADLPTAHFDLVTAVATCPIWRADFADWRT